VQEKKGNMLKWGKFSLPLQFSLNSEMMGSPEAEHGRDFVRNSSCLDAIREITEVPSVQRVKPVGLTRPMTWTHVPADGPQYAAAPFHVHQLAHEPHGSKYKGAVCFPGDVHSVLSRHLSAAV
jgi:hypothetical protein